MPSYLWVLVYALIPALIGVLMFYIESNNTKIFKENLGKEHVTLRLPKMYLFVGIIVALLFSGVILNMKLFTKDVEPAWVYVGYAMFVSLGVILILLALNWKVDVYKNEDYFLVRTIFLKTHKIYYKDCISFKFNFNTQSTIIKTNKKTFGIDMNASNYKFLIAMLRKHHVKQIKVNNSKKRKSKKYRKYKKKYRK